MKRTKTAKQKDGLTAAPPAGVTSLPVMKHGEEPHDMLLALLNSPLETLMQCQQARVIGTAHTPKGTATIVIFYGTQPTANGTLSPVGNVGKVKK